MSQALPGQHLCQAHQGNHSRYSSDNCVICRAKLFAESLVHFGEYVENLDDAVPDPVTIRVHARRLLRLIEEQR